VGGAEVGKADVRFNQWCVTESPIGKGGLAGHCNSWCGQLQSPGRCAKRKNKRSRRSQLEGCGAGRVA
jgi:hypothetical protein